MKFEKIKMISVLELLSSYSLMMIVHSGGSYVLHSLRQGYVIFELLCYENAHVQEFFKSLLQLCHRLTDQLTNQIK